MSSVFLVVKPSKIIFLIKYYTPKGGYNLTLYRVPQCPQIKYYSDGLPSVVRPAGIYFSTSQSLDTLMLDPD